jgi:hypothetical protein
MHRAAAFGTGEDVAALVKRGRMLGVQDFYGRGYLFSQIIRQTEKDPDTFRFKELDFRLGNGLKDAIAAISKPSEGRGTSASVARLCCRFGVGNRQSLHHFHRDLYAHCH